MNPTVIPDAPDSTAPAPAPGSTTPGSAVPGLPGPAAGKGSITHCVDHVSENGLFYEHATQTLMERLFPIAVKRARQYLNRRDASSLAHQEVDQLLTRTKVGDLRFLNRQRLFAYLRVLVEGKSLDRTKRLSRHAQVNLDLLTREDDSLQDVTQAILRLTDADGLDTKSCNDTERLIFDSLNEQQDRALELRCSEGLDVKEIAQRLNKPLAYVYRVLKQIEDLGALIRDYEEMQMWWLRNVFPTDARKAQLRKDLPNERHRQIFDAWLDGLTPPQIAKDLGLQAAKVYQSLLATDQRAMSLRRSGGGDAP